MASRRQTPQQPLSRERILDAAHAIVVTDGIGALSMRRVAAELGTGAMSLYNHVPGKDALLTGLAERVLAEVDVPEGASPRELCASWARSMRRTLMANPKVVPVVLSAARRPMLLERAHALIVALVDTGMDERDAHEVTSVLGRWVAGALVFDVDAARRGGSGADRLDRLFERGVRAVLDGFGDQLR